MRLKDIDPKTVVKVGMTHASNFIYTGELGGMDYDSFTAADLTATMDDLMTWVRTVLSSLQEKKKPPKKVLTMLINSAENLRDFAPVESREIADQFPSNVEDAQIVMIPGYVSGRSWLVDEAPKRVNVRHTDAAIQLVGAIHRGEKEELTSMYIDYLRNRNSETAVAIEIAKKNIRANEYGVLDDPEYLIEVCREEAINARSYVGGSVVIDRDRLREVLGDL